MDNELGLPPSAFERHDGQTGGSGSNLSAKIAPNDVEAQVQSGGRTRRGENSAIVHVKNVRVHFDRRVASGQVLSGAPVRGSLKAVQCSGAG